MGDDGGVGLAQVDFAQEEEAIGFRYEGCGERAGVVYGLHAYGGGNAGGSGDVPA